MKKRFLLLAFSICKFATLFSQYSIHGTVADENSKPLMGANIILQQTSKSALTNDRGEFSLIGIKTGDYILNVSFLGYETFSESITVNGDLNLNIKLANKSFLSDEVIVSATRASDNAPVTKSVITKEDIQKQNLGQDLPYLMALTPSLVTSSDAGAGVGYTNFRIRGTDLNRINVTVNGIPLNDAESHGVWWVDLPDFASSVENIQIQRGVGTSTLGGGAFGATINLQTIGLNKKPYAELTNSYGSFNTLKNSISFGSGLINNHFTFDGRLSKISSDGYIDRASSDLKSLYLSGSYYTEKSILKFNISSGMEKTYQAWDGVPGDSLKTNRTYNGLGRFTNAQGQTQYYDNQTDNYQLTHYQLLFSHSFNSTLNLNTALHYSPGKGYYEEYKEGQSLKKYTLQDIVIGDSTISKTNLIRRKWLDNAFYGFTWALNYSNNGLKVILGGGVNQYFGKHYGRLIWAQYFSDGQLDHQYYYSHGTKNDFNIFAKSTYQLGDVVSIFGDIQCRRIMHDINGEDDDHRNIIQKHTYNFFNPKIGVTLNLNEYQSFYGYLGIAHREPTRDDLVDADPSKPLPSSEELRDFEFGYHYASSVLKLGANLYYMNYNNQLILTGAINDVGSAIMTNVKKSYRSGIELVAGVKVLDKLSVDLNATLSRNIIKNFTSNIDNWDYWNDPATEPNQYIKSLGNTKLAFSPEVIAGSQITFDVSKNISLALLSKYIGKQYIDNTENESRKLNPYFINDLRINCKFKTKFISSIEPIFMLNNIFNVRYETNAWVYQYIENGTEKVLNGFFPQAGTNFLLGLVLKF